MVETYLLHHSWITALLWVVLYTSDYQLSLVVTRLAKAQTFLVTEGSCELTPEYQRGNRNDAKFSATLVVWLLFGAAVAFLPVILGQAGVIPWFYGLIIGALIVPELVIVLRHIDSIKWYRSLSGPNPGLSGSLTASRKYTYQRAAVSFALWAVILLCVSVLTLSPVPLGGAIEMAVRAWRQHQGAVAHKSKSDMVTSND